jgi:hypothetical protein
MIALKRIFFSRSLWLLLAAAGLSTILSTCKYPTGPLKQNTPPDTRLANVPQNDTIARYIERNAFPELSLSWVGDDPDGYVIGFQYRWVSSRPGSPFPVAGPWSTVLNITKQNWLNMIVLRGTPPSVFRVYNFLATLGANDTAIIRIVGDSLATQRPFAVPYKTGIIPTDSVVGASRINLQTPTTGTFIFDSPADSNYHRFEIQSVDNSDAVDPSPAIVHFWTLVSPGSLVTFDNVPVANAFCISQVTDRFPGLRFAYRSLDANNSEGFEFSWSVDDTLSWSPWSTSQEAFVNGSHFKPQPARSGTHYFHVRARNRWRVISPDSVRAFTVTVPAFNDPNYPKRTLIINDDLVTGNGTRGKPTLAQVDSFYAEIMDSIGRTGRYDVWRVGRGSGPSYTYQWPLRDTLGYYTSVVFLMEQFIPPIGPGSQHKFQVNTQGYFREYLTVGGNLIWSGTPSAPAGISSYNTFNVFSGTWATDVFHIAPNTQQSPYLMSQGLDFNGVRGDLGYPNVSLDTNRIAPDSASAIKNIGNVGINFPYGFAQTISFFNSRFGTFYQNLPVGVRFLGPRPIGGQPRTYSIVFFGFGLYYGEKSAVIASLRQAFIDIE